MWAPSRLRLCTYYTDIHNLLHSYRKVILGQISELELSLEQFQGFGGTWMCNIVHCFSHLAEDGHRNNCPTIHPDMRVSPLWLMQPVNSILNVILDTPVQQDFQVGVLSIVWFPILIEDTTRWGHIDQCDRSNQGVGSMSRLPHHMGHTMEVWTFKELSTQGLFSLRTTVRIIRISVQEVHDTTRVNLMVTQAIRTPSGVRSE